MKQQTKFKQTEIGKIPEDWEVKRLEDVSEFQYGLGESAEETGEFVYIRITDINSDGFLNKNNLKYINKNKVTKDYILSKGDVLVARTGATYGKTYFFRENFKATYGGFLIRFLFNKRLISNSFFFQFSRSNLYWNQANNLVGGGAQPQFNANVISELKIPLPSLSEQLQIAKILSSLDDKIELLQKQNKTLEAIGQALFKHWFVDFEFPDEEGNPYKSSGGEMVYNEELEKEIPKGWEVKNLKEELNFERGVEPGSKNYSEIKQKSYIRFIRVGDLNNNSNTHNYVPLNLIKNKICKLDDILLSLDATVGIVKIGYSGAYSSGIRKVYSKRNASISKPFIYWLVKTDYIQQTIRKYATGTTILHAGKSLEYLKVPLPNNIILDKYTRIALPLLYKILQNINQIQTLSKTRDLLLPKLMSGEIRVPLGGKE